MVQVLPFVDAIMIVFRCMDQEGKRFENHYLFDDELVHLVDEIFWLMGFKSAEHAEKVIS